MNIKFIALAALVYSQSKGGQGQSQVQPTQTQQQQSQTQSGTAPTQTNLAPVVIHAPKVTFAQTTMGTSGLAVPTGDYPANNAETVKGTRFYYYHSPIKHVKLRRGMRKQTIINTAVVPGTQMKCVAYLLCVGSVSAVAGSTIGRLTGSVSRINDGGNTGTSEDTGTGITGSTNAAVGTTNGQTGTTSDATGQSAGNSQSTQSGTISTQNSDTNANQNIDTTTNQNSGSTNTQGTQAIQNGANPSDVQNSGTTNYGNPPVPAVYTPPAENVFTQNQVIMATAAPQITQDAIPPATLHVAYPPVTVPAEPTGAAQQAFSLQKFRKFQAKMKVWLLIFLSGIFAQGNGTETSAVVTSNTPPKTTQNNIPQSTTNAQQTNTKNQQIATQTKSGQVIPTDDSSASAAPAPTNGGAVKQEVKSSFGVPVLTSIICAVVIVCVVIGIFIVRKFGLAPSGDFKQRLTRPESEPSVSGTPIVAIHSPKDLDYNAKYATDYNSQYVASEASFESGRKSPYAKKSPNYDERRPSNDYYARPDYYAQNSDYYQQNTQYYPQQQRPSFDSSRYDQRRPSNPEQFVRPSQDRFEQRRPSNPDAYGRPSYDSQRQRYNGH
ncbi:hypothetical protein HDV01_006709 [Terramyces sp. JEL0728]|nr:hypothetical protein HDV01_006709 [Terramyces sp. JEL0728]